MQLNKLIESLKLDKGAREEIDRVLALPEVQNIMEREEQKTVAHRQGLLKLLAAIPEQYSKRIALAAQKSGAAAKAVENAERTLRETRAAYVEANAALLAVESAERVEIRILTDELLAGADTRLRDLHRELDILHDRVRHLIEIQVFHEHDAFSRLIVSYLSNRDDVIRCTDSLRDAVKEVNDLAMAALSRADMTERMTAICARLEPTLAVLEIMPPSLDECGEIKPPKLWHGAKPLNQRVEEAA